MTTLGGSAAALLGALYALGAAVEWRRLTLADVRVADGLPLVPLPHVLTAGISVLLSMVIALIGVTIFLLLLRAVDRLVESRRINRHLERHSRVVRSMAISFKYQAKVETETADRLAKVRAMIGDFKPKEISAPKTDAERAELTAYKEEAEALLKEAEQHNADRLAMLDRLPRLQRNMEKYKKRIQIESRLYRMIVPAVRYGPLAFAIIVGGFLVSYPIGAGLVAAGLIWLAGTKTELPSADVRLALYIVVSVGVIANGIIGAPSLASARVTTNAGPVTGQLIALTETAWYVTTDRGAIKPIPVDRVQSGFTIPGATHHAQTLFQLVEAAV